MKFDLKRTVCVRELSTNPKIGPCVRRWPSSSVWVQVRVKLLRVSLCLCGRVSVRVRGGRSTGGTRGRPAKGGFRVRSGGGGGRAVWGRWAKDGPCVCQRSSRWLSSSVRVRTGRPANGGFPMRGGRKKEQVEGGRRRREEKRGGGRRKKPNFLPKSQFLY